ncbi:MAG: hypothetical protein ACOWWM_16870 [Desulfobacterales bacterium]
MKPLAKRLPDALTTMARGAYLVGGAVRDLLIGRQPDDLDIAVPGHPKAYAAELAERLGVRSVTIGKGGFEIERVVAEGVHYDICGLDGTDIHADLLRRDFTINAMAWDIDRRRLLDPTGGMADLAARRIRMVSRQNLEADPIRLLRAFRLAAAFRCAIDEQTFETIRQFAPALSTAAGERIRTELLKLMAVRESAALLSIMNAAGILAAVFPETVTARDLRKGRPASGTPFEDELAAYLHLETILRTPDAYFPGRGRLIDRSIGRAEEPVLKLAMLLSVPAGVGAGSGTDSPADDIRSMENIGRRLRLSGKERRCLTAIAAHCRRPILLFHSSSSATLSDQAIFNFYRSAGRFVPHTLLHAAAVTSGSGREGFPANLFHGFLCELLGTFEDRYLRQQSRPPLLTGTDLMERFGLKPSPAIGRLLLRIEENRYAGGIRTREAAFDLARQLLAEMDRENRL